MAWTLGVSISKQIDIWSSIFKWKPSRLSFNGEGLDCRFKAWTWGPQFWAWGVVFIGHEIHFHILPNFAKFSNLPCMLAWACDRPINWCILVQKWVRIMLKSCHVAMHLCMKYGSENHPNGISHCTHVQVLHSLSKWDDFELFGKMRSRETTIMLNMFSFEAWIMMNFKVEVWEIKHIWKKFKYQVKCSLLPP
jgi:hypothetical protein